MKKNYTFCKQDGTLKHYYIPICEYIIEAKMQKHEIMIGRYEDIVDVYECYTTPRREFFAKDRRSYESKIKEICSNFDVTTKYWYSYRDLSTELHGENVLEMIKILTELLEVTNNIR